MIINKNIISFKGLTNIFNTEKFEIQSYFTFFEFYFYAYFTMMGQ